MKPSSRRGFEDTRSVLVEPALELAHADELLAATPHPAQLAGNVLPKEVVRHPNEVGRDAECGCGRRRTT
jgi:hypothetical protein